MLGYYLRARRDPPAFAGYNPLQKAAYAVVLFVIAPLIAVTGAAMLPIPIFHPLADIFIGGVKLWHFTLMSLLSLFVIGHLGMVVFTGFSRNMRRMM